MSSISRLNLAVAALVLAGTALQAQTNSANVTASASVQSPINVAAGQALAFGTVLPGINKTIAASNLSSAGRFDATGAASTAVTISFTLPTTLSVGVNTMPIANFTGIYSTSVTQTSPISFTPSVGANPTLSAGGALFVWVGAQVQPAITQAAGTYTGTVTMTVVY